MKFSGGRRSQALYWKPWYLCLRTFGKCQQRWASVWGDLQRHSKRELAALTPVRMTLDFVPSANGRKWEFCQGSVFFVYFVLFFAYPFTFFTQSPKSPFSDSCHSVFGMYASFPILFVSTCKWNHMLFVFVYKVNRKNIKPSLRNT